MPRPKTKQRIQWSKNSDGSVVQILEIKYKDHHAKIIKTRIAELSRNHVVQYTMTTSTWKTPAYQSNWQSNQCYSASRTSAWEREFKTENAKHENYNMEKILNNPSLPFQPRKQKRNLSRFQRGKPHSQFLILPQVGHHSEKNMGTGKKRLLPYKKKLSPWLQNDGHSLNNTKAST